VRSIVSGRSTDTKIQPSPPPIFPPQNERKRWDHNFFLLFLGKPQVATMAALLPSMASDDEDILDTNSTSEDDDEDEVDHSFEFGGILGEDGDNFDAYAAAAAGWSFQSALDAVNDQQSAAQAKAPRMDVASLIAAKRKVIKGSNKEQERPQEQVVITEEEEEEEESGSDAEADKKEESESENVSDSDSVVTVILTMMMWKKTRKLVKWNKISSKQRLENPKKTRKARRNGKRKKKRKKRKKKKMMMTMIMKTWTAMWM
jgi:hypothetical protein